MGPVSVKLTGDLYTSVCQDEPLLRAHVATIRLADVGESLGMVLLLDVFFSKPASRSDHAAAACLCALGNVISSRSSSEYSS